MRTAEGEFGADDEFQGREVELADGPGENSGSSRTAQIQGGLGNISGMKTTKGNFPFLLAVLGWC